MGRPKDRNSKMEWGSLLYSQLDQYWYYSRKYGWVVMDRNDYRNAPEPDNHERCLILCKDWTEVIVPRTELKTFVLWRRYLNHLDAEKPEAARESAAALKSLQDEFTVRRASFKKAREQQQLVWEARHRDKVKQREKELEQVRHEAARQATIEAHQKFLERRKLPQQKVRLPAERNIHRVAHCYLCKRSLDNAEDIECQGCGWIVCRCGACGCRYTGAI